jgi:hypothetical protein
MTVDVDMTNNRVPYGLLTDEERGALHEHGLAGGEFEIHAGTSWWPEGNTPWHHKLVLRTVPLPKTQDVIAWDKLPEWVEWVARDEIDGAVHAYDVNDPWLTAEGGVWLTTGGYRRIDDFPGIVFPGTCDWKDSKQRRPRG